MSEGVFSHVTHICNAIVFIILCVDFFRCIFGVPFFNFAYNIMPLEQLLQLSLTFIILVWYYMKFNENHAG